MAEAEAQKEQGHLLRAHPRSAPHPGHPAGIPKVVISGASRHQVVNAHRARLSDAVHSVLGLDQHLCVQGLGRLGEDLYPSLISPP